MSQRRAWSRSQDRRKLASAGARAALRPLNPGAGRGPRIAPFEPAHKLAERAGREAARSKRVLQRGQQRHGREPAGARSTTRRRKTPGGVRFNGKPAESSIYDVPAAQFCRHPAGKLAIGVTSAAVAPGVSSYGGATTRSSMLLLARSRTRTGKPPERGCRV